MFSYDKTAGKVVDQETGDWVSRPEYHYQEDPTQPYTIMSANGDRLFTLFVERHAIDETGNSGGATLVQLTLHKAIDWSGGSPRYLGRGEGHRQIDRLIEYFRHQILGKTPEPRLEVDDCRGGKPR